ncbi:TRAP transporter substrate-binding protein [Paenisporosarcina antarctica]|uniref:TRAP transporter substrate-binding protein n=1 Tax=Paenisporosarcina antarctica TaxID=417367 RepID=A0A4P6ZZ77_9BACL|nr:TRAP transporter substrate-binding protein [Paenisporosarcina antarctica]QBP41871.1 TRAP transporter substrate-binding protein [Paenisporosarcina antarctica]
MKKLIFVAAVTMGLSAILAGCGDSKTEGSSDGESLKILAAHNQTSPDNPYQTGLLKFEEVLEDSNANIEVEVHAGTLGTEESELVEKLKLGAADVIVVSPGFMSQTGVKEVDLLALPYLFESYEHWESVVDGEVGDQMAELINEKSNNDFKLVGYWSAGVRHYYGKKPIESMDDLKGLSIRTQTSGVVSDYWTQAGAVPTSVAWGELYQALQQNVVDSSENAYPYFVQQNHHKTKNGKFISETAHDYTTRLMLVNGKKFDAMTDEQKEALLEAATASVEAEREAVYAQEEEYKQKAIDEGAVVNEIDTTKFQELAIPIQDKLAVDIGAEEIVEQINSLRK